LLLETLAGGETGPDRPLFHTFETLREGIDKDRSDFWKKVLDLHSLVIGWYEDRDLYHRIGLLVTDGVPFSALVDLTLNHTKSSYISALDERIQQRLGMTETDVRELTYQAQEKCNRVLLLMNVETVRHIDESSQRYSFKAHAAGQWSLEHIHAQRSKDFTTAKQWSEWLRLHAVVLATLPGVDGDERDSLIERINKAIPAINRGTFDPLEQEIYRLYAQAGPGGNDDVDSIANLALLGRDDNSALSNAVFEAKRRRILELDQAGSYIPICTRNAFLKYYTAAEGQQVQFWGPHDRQGYVDAMIRIIKPYLVPEDDTL
jgi:Protein of unknown function (DUF1524)